MGYDDISPASSMRYDRVPEARRNARVGKQRPAELRRADQILRRCTTSACSCKNSSSERHSVGLETVLQHWLTNKTATRPNTAADCWISTIGNKAKHKSSRTYQWMKDICLTKGNLYEQTKRWAYKTTGRLHFRMAIMNTACTPASACDGKKSEEAGTSLC